MKMCCDDICMLMIIICSTSAELKLLTRNTYADEEETSLKILYKNNNKKCEIKFMKKNLIFSIQRTGNG